MNRQIYIINNECPECGVELPDPFEEEILGNKSILVDDECKCNNTEHRLK